MLLGSSVLWRESVTVRACQALFRLWEIEMQKIAEPFQISELDCRLIGSSLTHIFSSHKIAISNAQEHEIAEQVGMVLQKFCRTLDVRQFCQRVVTFWP